MRLRLLIGIGVALLAVAACAAPEAGPGAQPSATPSSPGPSSPASSGTDLTIVVADAGGTQTTWRLTCDPPGGTHPDPAAACRALAEHGAQALAPVPKDRVCAQVYGGPETASITGTWRGAPVTSRLSRTNSCESARWQALEGLLPPGGR